MNDILKKGDFVDFKNGHIRVYNKSDDILVNVKEYEYDSIELSYISFVKDGCDLCIPGISIQHEGMAVEFISDIYKGISIFGVDLPFDGSCWSFIGNPVKGEPTSLPFKIGVYHDCKIMIDFDKESNVLLLFVEKKTI